MTSSAIEKREQSMKIINSFRNLRSRSIVRKIWPNLTASTTVRLPINVRGWKYITVGNDCYFGPGCRIEAWDSYGTESFSPTIMFGARTRVAGNLHIGAINSVVIGEDVLIGRDVFITDHAHGNSSIEQQTIAPNDRPLFSKGAVYVGDKVWICERAIILPGVHIGSGSIIGAGAVVTHDVPEGCVVGGNPARIVKHIVPPEQ